MFCNELLKSYKCLKHKTKFTLSVLQQSFGGEVGSYNTFVAITLHSITNFEMMGVFQYNTTTTPWLYSPCRTLASFTTIFQSSVLCARILQFVTPILLRSSLTSSIHLNLGLPTLLLPSGMFWYNLFITLSSPILSTCPSHLNLPFFISVTMSNSPYNCLTSFCLSCIETQ